MPANVCAALDQSSSCSSKLARCSLRTVTCSSKLTTRGCSLSKVLQVGHSVRQHIFTADFEFQEAKLTAWPPPSVSETPVSRWTEKMLTEAVGSRRAVQRLTPLRSNLGDESCTSRIFRRTNRSPSLTVVDEAFALQGCTTRNCVVEYSSILLDLQFLVWQCRDLFQRRHLVVKAERLYLLLFAAQWPCSL